MKANNPNAKKKNWIKENWIEIGTLWKNPQEPCQWMLCIKYNPVAAHQKLSFSFGIFLKIMTTKEIPHSPADPWTSNDTRNTISISETAKQHPSIPCQTLHIFICCLIRCSHNPVCQIFHHFVPVKYTHTKLLAFGY